ncbi:hypothetical protein CKO12_00190 [Chromatium okenii]|nr:hypothetical protein [Chromatium okenii]
MMNRIFYSRSQTLLALALTAVMSSGCVEESAEQQFAHAQTALGKGELKTAIIDLKNVLKKDARHQQARLLLGQAYVRSGDVGAAEQELKKAVTVGATEIDVQPWLTLVQLQQGKFAEVAAQQPLATAPPLLQAQLLALQADALQALKDTGGAAAKLAEAVKLAPESVPVLLASARLQATNNQIDAARAVLQQALALEPKNAQVLSLLGEVERMAGQWSAAEAAFTAAMSDPAFGMQAQLNRASVRIQANQLDTAAQDLAQLRGKLKNNPQFCYLEGLLLYNQKNYAEAITQLDVALGLRPDFFAALTLAGATRLALNDSASAQVHLQRAVAAQPDDPTAQRLLATALLQQNDFREAEKVVRVLLQRQPDDVAAKDLLASALLGQGKSDESITYLRQVKAEMPDSAAATARLGTALLSDGDTQEGVRVLQEALKQDPTFQSATEQLVFGALRSDKLDQALRMAQEYQAQEPNSARAQTLLGMVQLQRQDAAAARSAFQQALTLDPKDLTASSALAALAMQDKDLNGANAHLNASLKHHPNNARLHIMLAKIALAQNDPLRAKTHLETAYERNPKLLEPQLYLAAYYLQRGEPARAQEIAIKAETAFPNHPAALGVVADTQIALRQFAPAQITLKRLQDLKINDPKLYIAQAIAAAGLGEIAPAKQALEQALKLDAKSAIALNLLTRLALAEKDSNGAQRRLQQLKTQLGATHPDVLLLEGQLAQLNGNTSAANNAFQALMSAEGFDANLDSNTTLWNAAEQLVISHLRNQQPAAALAAALDLTARQPQSARAQALLGMLYLQDKKTDAATTALRRALELEPGNVTASNGLAVLAVQAKDLAAAKEYYSASLQRHPDDIGLLVNLARVALSQNELATARQYLETAVQRNPQQLQPRLYLAAFHLKQNDAEQALRVLKAVEKQYPTGVDLLGLIAEAELTLKRYPEARATLARLATLNPREAKIWLAIAQAEMGLAHPDLAQKALEDALALDARSIPALIGLTRLAMAQTPPAQAQARLAALTKVAGADHADVLLLSGNVAEQEQNWAAARVAYQKLLQTAPSTVGVLALTRVLNQLKETTAAQRVLTEWVAEHPQDGLIHFQLAQLLMLQQHIPEAIMHFRHTLESNAKNVVALNNLAWLLREQEPEAALDYAQQAYDLAPKSIEVVDTLAMVLAQNDKLREARNVINRALEIDPENGALLFHKAQILLKDRDTALALQALDVALSRQKSFAERDAAEALLKQLRP